jgi:carbohydrate binding protein with CBM6 domain
LICARELLNEKAQYVCHMRNLSLLLFIILIASCNSSTDTDRNNGLATVRSNAFNGPAGEQSVPGRLQCEQFDTGGEGIAYHDADSINNGSGKLNPVNGNVLHEFRMKEGVDISYTKTGGIDDNPFNKFPPDSNQLYVGWTEPGEWVNYTFRTNEAGIYQVGIMYTANGDGQISFDIDQKAATGALTIFSTHNSKDTIAWRQWHHWNRIDSLTTLRIEKGVHSLKFHILEHGQMNFDYLSFVKRD